MLTNDTRRLTGRLLLLCAPFCLALCLTMLTGCNTMEGAGEDVQATGEAIEDAAD